MIFINTSQTHSTELTIVYNDFVFSFRKFHDRVKRYETINLSDNKYESKTKRFIDLYSNFKAQGALDDEKMFEVALEQLGSKQKFDDFEDEIEEPVDFGLTSSFTQAMKESRSAPTNDEKPKTDKRSGSIDVKSLF